MEDNRSRSGFKKGPRKDGARGAERKFSKPGDRKFGDKKFGDKKFGDKKFGEGRREDKHFSDRSRSDHKPGEKRFENGGSEGRGFGAKRSFDGKKREFSDGIRPQRTPRPNSSMPKSSRTQVGADKKYNDQPKKVMLDNRIEIALQTIIDVEKNGKYINLAFKNNEKLDRLDKKDRAYVMRILYGVTEKSYTLDWLLQRVLKDKRIKPWLNAILRVGTYQIFFMRIEDAEAIEQAKLLCNKYVSEELCGFVTAVLSKLSENKDEYNPELFKFASTTQRLAVTYSYPEWLIDMWLADYGLDTTMSLLENANAERSINLRVAYGESVEGIINQLSEARINCELGMLFNTVTISDTVNIENLDLYRDGKITAQGIGSMLTVNALQVKDRSTVLDACAAPGGKTFYIAEKTKGQVESCDIHEHRVELIKKGAERLGLENINAVCRDMTVPVEEYVDRFDRVLVDAPCSGYGMINSKPDIKNNAVPGEVDDLAKIQQDILCACSEYVKEGGIMVYSTCTVSKKENEQNVKRFIADHPEFELIDISSDIPEVLNYSVEDGMVTLFPSRHNADAFFISAMRRK